MNESPRRGEVIWLTLNPQAGHEQAGRRPVVVLSPDLYNMKTGLCLVCPITHAVKGYPFEVVLPPHLPVAGVVLADQVKSLDWRARCAERICTLPVAIVQDVLAKVKTLL